MKTSKKLFFSFLFLSFFLISISPFSMAFDPETTTVKSNWFYEQLGIFQDINPHPWENKIKFSQGGEDLLYFNNLGIVSYNDSEVLYKAEATFGFEVTAHTYVGFRDVFPNIDLNEEHSEMFFRIQRKYPSGTHNSYSYVYWNTINYGDIARYHEYIGSMPITVGIRESTPPSGTITLNGVSFAIPEYATQIIQVKVDNVRDGEVGSYNDIFTNIPNIVEGNVELDELSNDFSADESKIIGYFNKYELGWREGTIERGQTLQQWWIDTDQKGSTFHNYDTTLNNPFTFGLFVNLQPEVYEYVQYNEIRYAEIKYMTWGLLAGTLDTLNGPSTKSAPKRIVAVHTSNYFIHTDFTVDVVLYARVPSTAQLTQSILADPYLKRGDMVWDTSFTGDYKVSVPLTTLEWWDMLGLGGLFDFFGGIAGILIIIVVLVILGIGAFIIYKIYKARQQQKMIENVVRGRRY